MANAERYQKGLLVRIKRLVANFFGLKSVMNKDQPYGADLKPIVSVGKPEPGSRKEVGLQGEKLAAELLKRNGYKILHRNFRCRQGEIDIIAQAGECLVFVEVRTKKNCEFGTPEESITVSKRVKLVTLSNAYLQTLDSLPSSWRIDVVAVELGPDNSVLRLNHIENAVS